MSIRQKIREYLQAHEGPAWGCEIIAATGCTKYTIRNMAKDEQLIRHKDGPAVAYTVGNIPRKAMTPEERVIARKRAQRKYYATIRKAVRAKQRRPKKEKPAVKRVQIALASKHNTVGGESVAEYLARGGQIQRLPGIQKSTVYQQRRPVMGSYRSMGA